MDSRTIDTLAVSISRKRVLQRLAAVAAVGFGVTTLPLNEVDAKKKKKKKKKPSIKQPRGLEDPKCWICHVPPGNPGNAHALHVGCPATGPQGHSNHNGDCIEGEASCHIPVKEENAYCWKGNTCIPEDDPCGNRECDSVKDRCGNDVSCGTCESGTCEDGQCSVCTPNCQDGDTYTCGDDGCGGICVCPSGSTCGLYSPVCVPLYLS